MPNGAKCRAAPNAERRAGAKAPDFVVFAEPDDMVLLGSRALEGMNLRVDPQRKQLVPAGPVLAGVTA